PACRNARSPTGASSTIPTCSRCSMRWATTAGWAASTGPMAKPARGWAGCTAGARPAPDPGSLRAHGRPAPESEAARRHRAHTLEAQYAFWEPFPMPAPVVYESSLHSLPLVSRGKVRDNYAVGEDRLLIVTTDRLSAFDVVLGEPIPDKGRVLNQMALFWFERLAGIVPNHLTGEPPESVVAADEVAQVRGRSMLVR